MEQSENQIEKLTAIKNWLGTGSVNIFGLPMSGKDTVGVRFAELIGAKFLSSGMIIRASEKETKKDLTSSGELIDTNVFYDLILPYFERPELVEYPLVLSSVGRWSGEEDQIMAVAKRAGHEIKAVALLQISEQDVVKRREAAILLNDRGGRQDDTTQEIFEKRIEEFRQKTLPVIKHYQELGLLVEVKADQSRPEVLTDLINKLYDFATKNRL